MPPTMPWCCAPAFRWRLFGLEGKGFKIGTNAVRRAAYLRRLFPEVTVIHYRGAADTRVQNSIAATSSGFPTAARWGLRTRW